MKLNATARAKIPTNKFAGPGRSFPVNDATHARMAVSGATRSEHSGNIGPEEAERIRTKARGALNRIKGPKNV